MTPRPFRSSSEIDSSHALSSDDAVLAQRVRAGDEAAFAELVRAHANSALVVAFRVLHSRDAAKDVAQRTFAAIWEQRARFAPVRSIRNYVLSAARYQAVSDVRHALVEQRHRANVLAAPRVDATDAASRDTAAVEDRATISALLEKLPDRRRQALELRYLEQRSFAEVGDIMGLSAGAAKILVIRGLEVLRRRVGAFEAPHSEESDS
jgi:RNA polymerase sigma-70 factor, ECF subfamily